jgi:hypothetical protein
MASKHANGPLKSSLQVHQTGIHFPIGAIRWNRIFPTLELLLLLLVCCCCSDIVPRSAILVENLWANR